MYLGDYAEDDTVHFLWSSNDADGAAVTRTTDGTISVYKDNGTTQSTAGITDTEDFDSVTGVHACSIDLSSDAFYATGADYAVVLSGATIDGQTVNTVLAHFSIENRTSAVASTPPTVDEIGDEIETRLGVMRAATAQAGAAGSITLDASASATNDLYNGATIVLTGGTGAGQCNAITDYVGSTKIASVARTWATNPSSDTTFVILPQGLEGLLAVATGSLNESNMAIQSLYTAIAKAVHKILDNAGALEIYRSDGSTQHAEQAITTDTNNEPIDQLGGAAAP